MSNNTVGGWSAFRDVDNADKSFFESVLNGLVGMKYTPIFVATQIVSGTNYSFLSKAIGAFPNAQLNMTLVRIYKPLSGEAHITSIEKIEP
ncbi:hypothetical protein [Pectobacterium parmentieri]|uniref:Uncharacterized protein n=1 Tax=Pectobacterium parmentieri TaxID=1905730 RepID=A0A8B3FRF3_PECPM|nr:hypothetical protein [Pectobacterium parmentieri]AOR59258.1 hypothetical protein A8F97_10075 [Pectobacterium parmentieri]AYH09727.1 hypothetical protein C5E24_08560 [Pectobacterium parmentieri]AYH19564.1 hypothetical protein C5E22_14240 [Pectobacterium parmentieri]AYH36047.1 hypothetical protein C5E17_08510 [Pectobacterium parmentieri]AZS56151.1 hypothetical protein C5E18_08505 [Pectobacterium parmentieri]